MKAQIILGKAKFTIRDADHLHVAGELVEIQRTTPAGYETVAVAGEDLLVTIEPAEGGTAEAEAPAASAATKNGALWLPVGEPLD